jgi:hypothetical protein
MAEIHHLITISASLDTVHGLVSTAEGFRQWWAADVEQQSDGRVSLGFFNRTTEYRLELLDGSAGRAIWRCRSGKEWQDTDLTFRLESQGSGVLLDFTHAQWREATPYFVSCNTTWGALMFRLKSAAEGRNPGPLFQKESMGY